MRVEFTVPFVAGKGRPRFVRKTGGAYTPDATKRAMRDVSSAYVAAADGAKASAGVPVGVVIVTERPLPKSRPRRVDWEHDTFTPDADNVAKLVLDALKGIAWHDDKQVTRLSVVKCPRARGASDRTSVSVWWDE